MESLAAEARDGEVREVEPAFAALDEIGDQEAYHRPELEAMGREAEGVEEPLGVTRLIPMQLSKRRNATRAAV